MIGTLWEILIRKNKCGYEFVNVVIVTKTKIFGARFKILISITITNRLSQTAQ